MKRDALDAFENYLAELNSTAIGRRAFLGMVPLLLGACASTGSRHRTREGDNRGQETQITIEDERKLAREVLPDMEKDYPPVQSADMQLYVKALGAKLVRASSLEGNPYNYNFSVVGVNQINAFALPAGTIFVTAPLLAKAESEAELAGVIGHEIGHVKARHTAERMQRQKDGASESWFMGAGGGLLGAAAGFGVGKIFCAKNDTKCLVTATGLGAAAGVGGALLVQKYKFMANSREDEMEADRIGFKTAVAAGYEKDHAGIFYSKLWKMEQEHKQNKTPILAALGDALSTHPPSEERVKQMRELAASTVSGKKAVTNTKDFDRVRKMAQKWESENGQQKAAGA